MISLDSDGASGRSKKPSQRLIAYVFYITWVLVSFLAAAVLVSLQAK